MTDLQSPAQGLYDKYHTSLAELAGTPPNSKPPFSVHSLPWWYVLSTLKQALGDANLDIEGRRVLVGDDLDSIKRAHRLVGAPESSVTTMDGAHRFALARWVESFEHSIWSMQFPALFDDSTDVLLAQFLQDINALAAALDNPQLAELIRIQPGHSGRKFISDNINAVTQLSRQRTSGDYLEFPEDMIYECWSIFGLDIPGRQPDGGSFYMQPYLRLIAVRINLEEVPQAFDA